MKLIIPTRVRFVPGSDQERQLVREELAEILRSVHFMHSKRYPALLTYVVEKTLDGLAADLKERTLGVDVFHRRPDYDNNDDTIVRVTAGEVRKRLALVYHESRNEHPVQIELPPGSYVPEFFQIPEAPEAPEAPETQAASTVHFAPPEVQSVHPLAEPLKKPLSGKHLGAGLVCGVLLLVCLFGFWAWTRATSVDRFWQPMRTSGAPSIVAAGAFVFSASSPTGRVLAEKMDVYPYMSMATTGSIAMLTQQFGRSHMDYLLQSSVSTTLTEMRGHPTVLVGAYDNEWTLRLVNDLRFRFAPRPNIQIYDSKNPSTTWSRPNEMPAYKDADDYAIIARFKDKLTENTVVVIAGIGQNGTTAATQFVTSARYLDLLDRQSKGWESKNLEFVIRTKVIDGRAGPPTIEAIDLW